MAKTGLNIFQLNVNGYLNKQNLLVHIINERNPDIILFNDTGVSNRDKIKIAGYKIIQCNISIEFSDGVLMGIKWYLKIKNVIIRNGYIFVKLQMQYHDIVIGTMYVPPRFNGRGLAECIRTLANFDCPSYLIGDLNAAHRNINLKNKKHNNVNGKIVANGVCNNLINILGPHFPTYVERGTQSRPDIIIANRRAYFNIKAEPGEAGISDHIPTLVRIDAKPIYIKIRERYAPKLTNWEEYATICENIIQIKNLEGGDKNLLDFEINVLLNKLKNIKELITPKI